MSSYGWLITECNQEFLEAREIGTMGPHDCTFTAEEIRAKGKRFRMLDGDDEWYYTGYAIFTEDEDGDEESEFAPLEDFGTPNAGAVTIQYWYTGAGGGWKTL